MEETEMAALDRTFRALADETRRRIWTLLGERPGASTSELTAAFPLLSRWAVMKHLGVLRDAGLVQTLPDGRARRHYPIETGLDPVRAWLGSGSVGKRQTNPSVDRTLLRERLRLTPLERSRLGVAEARALQRLLDGRLRGPDP